MNRLEVIDLLALVTLYDNRNADDDVEIGKWLKAAQLGRWDVRSACEAVHEFFAMPHDPRERRRWLEPSHVAWIVRSKRSGPPRVSELRAVGGGPPASAEARRAAIALFRLAVGTQEVETTIVSNSLSTTVSDRAVSDSQRSGVQESPGAPVRGFAGVIRPSNHGRGGRS